MIFDTSTQQGRKKAVDRVKHLLDKKAKFEVIEKKRKRTYSQNNYLHLILGWFSLELGYKYEYTKQIILKQYASPSVFKSEFVNEKTGELIEYFRSTKDLKTDEMSVAIEHFRTYSEVKAGLYLPTSKDTIYLEEIENELEKYNNKIYL
ncbi:hypothetical protein BAX93_05350 [Elizabethkingia meningoseptica]|uniref:recombination protein NinB n=1 Tax=Elizabethkingia meningoseptica TaxID=238 RepID=UPI0009998BD8|nr:recombination protein NinB [Elizabethkingia meningoseptica]OPC11928.1 hypothetical protein BAX93_05350 [Elizabethkingia meningoseptica]